MKSFAEKLFRFRGYTPIPFLLAMIIFEQPSTLSMIVGVVLVALGEAIRLWGVAYAGSLTRVTGEVGAPEIIVAGPFAYVRNPLYVGNMLTYIGIGIMSNALFPWLVFAALLWFAFQYYQIVLLEEEFLQQKFTTLYSEYRKAVPRFLPRLKPWRHNAQENQKPNWNEAVRSEKRTFQALALVLFIILLFWLVK